MIAVDTNILIHAFRESSPFHQPALTCLTKLAQGGARWAIPWPCVHEFLSFVTNPKIPPAPVPMTVALAAVRAWKTSPMLTMLSEAEGDAHWTQLASLLVAGRVVGPKVHDARIAAICLEHGVSELLTADRDFGRFPALRTRNPLVDG
jgi:uncharacterized protein